MGDSAVAGCNDAEISGMFKVIAKDAASTQNPVAAAISGGVKRVGDAAHSMQDAWNKSINDMNAWRNQ